MFYQQYNCETQKAANALQQHVLADAGLKQAFEASAFLAWAHDQVQSIAVGHRSKVIPSLEIVPGTGGSTKSSPQFQTSQRSYTRQQATSAATIFDTPLYGRRLGDLTGQELVDYADADEVELATRAQKNKFARAIAAQMKDLNRTVEESLTEAKLERIKKSVGL